MEDLFRFEDYYFSDNKDDYQKDLNQKNILIKQINQLIKEHGKDEKNLQRLVNNIILMKNVFTKEAILEFANKKFNEKELGCVGNIFYDIVVNSSGGIVSNHKKYADEVFNLMKVKDGNQKIDDLWEDFKKSIK